MPFSLVALWVTVLFMPTKDAAVAVAACRVPRHQHPLTTDEAKLAIPVVVVTTNQAVLADRITLR